MYLVLGAMNEEIAAYRDVFQVISEEDWNGFPSYRMRYRSLDLVVAKSGVGKVLAAMVCQHLLEVYTPQAVIFTGIGGALNPSYDIGDLVVSRDCMQHDLDATALGIPRGKVPFTSYHVLEADPCLRAFMQGFAPSWGRVWEGRVLTGDQFVAGAQRGRMAYLIEELEGDVVEMEGASVGLVCTVNRTPFLLLRIISDRADGNAPSDFSAFLGRASSHLAEALVFLLDRLGERGE
ncbi:5'-methylthioadenosine/adenosylhomocysteine nucleosidase [Spirochaeta thermophila]|uniref:adenosylhomocysteine nucleosidase n=1 Tax=Winmispira thermophila (strain ATCC 49972 / DSM 6192 / RI 19.B1) TaxID=665571 RepID=E0RTH7_WINT6|nr:5'-methylthioadenosine/adenosylhomocysteine nucleosidase [Spirochaeta thermophila]ADN02208.1 MTA/SAH nucleosidase [Spirochaeta thermophila DSM 6192]